VHSLFSNQLVARGEEEEGGGTRLVFEGYDKGWKALEEKECRTYWAYMAMKNCSVNFLQLCN